MQLLLWESRKLGTCEGEGPGGTAELRCPRTRVTNTPALQREVLVGGWVVIIAAAEALANPGDSATSLCSGGLPGPG